LDHLTFDLFQKLGFRLKDRIIWRYWGGMAFKSKFTNKHKTILWWTKPGHGTNKAKFDVFPVREATKFHDSRNNLFGRNPGNVWEVDRVAFGSNDQTSHIAVFPEEISDRIILATTNEDDLVFDPFSGSGTGGDLGSLSGTGAVRILGGRLLDLPFLGPFADLLQLKGMSRIVFEQAQANYRIDQGRLYTENLLLAAANATVAISGWGGFLQGLDSPIQWTIVPNLQTQTAEGEEPSGLGELISAGTKILVGEVRLTGTWNRQEKKIVPRPITDQPVEEIIKIKNILEGLF